MFYNIYNLKKVGMVETGSNRINSPGTTWGRERRRIWVLGVTSYTLPPLTLPTVLQGGMTICILDMRTLGQRTMLSPQGRARTQVPFCGCFCFCHSPWSSMGVSQLGCTVQPPSQHYAWSLLAHCLASKLLTTWKSGCWFYLISIEWYSILKSSRQHAGLASGQYLPVGHKALSAQALRQQQQQTQLPSPLPFHVQSLLQCPHFCLYVFLPFFFYT